jgi:thiol-disulfide isomerase/thioredoxin
MNSSTVLRKVIVGGLLAWMASAGMAAPLQAGDVPPPWLGYTRDGDAIKVTDFAGKAIVVTFWATWCPYCLKELPVLENVQNAAGKDKIEVIAVNVESRDVFRRAWSVMHEQFKMTLVNDVNRRSQDPYEATGLPTMVIIGRDGRVRKVYRGYSADQLPQIVDDINWALMPPAAPR